MIIIRGKKDGSRLTEKDITKITAIVRFAYLMSQPHQQISLPNNYDKEETLAHEIPDLTQINQIMDNNIQN